MRIDATPDTKSETIVPVKDASADELIEKAKAMLFSALSPHNNKSVDPLIPFEKPKVPIVDSVDKVKDDDEIGFTSVALESSAGSRRPKKEGPGRETSKQRAEETRRGAVAQQSEER